MNRLESIYVVRPLDVKKKIPKEFHRGEVIQDIAPHIGGDGSLHDGSMQVLKVTGYINNRSYLQAKLGCIYEKCDTIVNATAVLGKDHIVLTEAESDLVDLFVEQAIKTLTKKWY